MFRIGTAPKLPFLGSIDRAVVDEQRDASLHLVSRLGSVPDAQALLLKVGSLQIPMETHVETTTGKQPPFVVMIDRFGYSLDVEKELGLGRVSFESDEERHRLLMLAVEALLVFGFFFDGLGRPDGEFVVKYVDKLWRLSDFGYATTKGSDLA